MDEVNQEWLKTEEGRAWLRTEDGTAWFRTTEGQWWSRSDDAHAWYEELGNRGWAARQAGGLPPPPENAITPDTAPKVGTRVRLARTETTLGGTTLHEGETATVTDIQLKPMGWVWLVLRTDDGRKSFAMFDSDYEVA